MADLTSCIVKAREGLIADRSTQSSSRLERQPDYPKGAAMNAKASEEARNELFSQGKSQDTSKFVSLFGDEDYFYDRSEWSASGVPDFATVKHTIVTRQFLDRSCLPRISWRIVGLTVGAKQPDRRVDTPAACALLGPRGVASY